MTIIKKSFILLSLILLLTRCNNDEDTTDVSIGITTTEVSNITNISATSGGNITNAGSSEIVSGVCYSIQHSPDLTNNHTEDNSNNGVFISHITSLQPETIYYLRAYVTEGDITIYGNEVEFTTLGSSINLPSVTTLPVKEKTQTTALCGGAITDNGGDTIMARGVCYSTTSNPTIDNNTTVDGTGIGNFTSNLVGLTENTTYYFRAYATNSEGTGYGNELIFNTKLFPGILVTVTGSTFNMGSNGGNTNEQPIHSVTLSDYSISKYEITNEQYANYMNSINANADGSIDGVEYLDMDDDNIQIFYNSGVFIVDAGKENYPVIEVSRYGAKAYCEYYGGRLPTEAEWEFAARGGKNSNNFTYSGSDNLDVVAWYFDNSSNSDNPLFAGRGSHIVGTKSANEIGIFDMSGNVTEWTNDWYKSDYYSSSPSNNPQGPTTGQSHTLRGGSWRQPSDSQRVSFRDHFSSGNTYFYVGFRPVFNP